MTRKAISAQRPQQAAPPAENYASTYWRTALRLAVLRTLAILAGLATAACSVFAVWQVSEMGGGWLVVALASLAIIPLCVRSGWVWRVLAGACLILAIAAGYFGWSELVWSWKDGGFYLIAAVVGAVVGTVFCVSLWTYTTSLRRALWAIEERTGQDLDGDGRVGREPVGHVVRVRRRGGRQENLTMPNLEKPAVIRPLIHFPGARRGERPVTAADVVYILTRAISRRDRGDQLVGLTFRQWEGHQLPSDTVVDRPTWAGVLDGMVAWKFAIERKLGGRRRSVELRPDIDVEDMIRAVKLAVKEP